MSRSPRTLTRRALVAGGVAGTAVALTGCDQVGDLIGDSEDPTASGAVTPTAPAVDADSALVAEVVQAVVAVSTLATATGTAVPALARTGAHLARLHDAHVVRLGGAGTSDPAEPAEPPAIPTGRAAALRRLLQAEERLQDRLVAAAGAAQSGGLAQVLAAMAAAVAQQRAEAGMSQPTPSAGPEEIQALQVALAAEHAAVFVYAALGAQTSRSAAPTLFTRVTRAYLVHRTRRDRLSEMVAAAGADPVPAEPGYALPNDLGTAAAVNDRARALEEAAAETYAYLVVSTSGPARTWAIEALLDAAVRGLDFGGRPQRLPGI